MWRLLPETRSSCTRSVGELTHTEATKKRQEVPKEDGVLNSGAVTKKCVTLQVLLFFVFIELREELLGMVCHFVGDL
jgi:hypothetical protein